MLYALSALPLQMPLPPWRQGRILFYGKELIRPTLAQMLRNPVYVQQTLMYMNFLKVRVRL